MPLTEEMLNELNKNHMSGVDNLGNDAFYDVGDAWDPPTFPSKPVKVTHRCSFTTQRRYYSINIIIFELYIVIYNNNWPFQLLGCEKNETNEMARFARMCRF